MLFKVLYKEDVHAKKIMLDEELLQYIRFLRNVSFYTFFKTFFRIESTTTKTAGMFYYYFLEGKF